MFINGIYASWISWIKSLFSPVEFKYAAKTLSLIGSKFVSIQAQKTEDIYDTDEQTVIDQKKYLG